MSRLLLVFAFLISSASTASAQYSRPQEGTREVRVINRNWSNIVVFTVLPSKVQMRVGLVTAVSRSTFHLPARFFARDGELRIYLHPVGGQVRGPMNYMTETVRMFDGAVAELMIPNTSLEAVSLAVWDR